MVDVQRLRPVTPQEIVRIAAEITNAEVLGMYREFAESLYGRKDVILQFDLESQYDDEGGYFNSITDITATDPVTGEVIPYDYTTPFWVEAFEDVDPCDYDGMAYDALFAESDVIDLLPVPDSWETNVDLRGDGTEKLFKLYIEE